MLMLRPLYGGIELTLKWYKLYSETLMEKGFRIKQYDICVANKLVNGKQCTIVWYVDSKKMSHMEAKVVDDFINDLKKHFGELVVTKVRKHTCLGVNINIPEDKKVEINMKEQFLESI